MQNSVASDNSAASRGFLGSPANVLRPPGLFRDLMDLLPTDLLAPTSQSNPQEAPGPRSSGLGSGGSGEALTITQSAIVWRFSGSFDNFGATLGEARKSVNFV